MRIGLLFLDLNIQMLHDSSPGNVGLNESNSQSCTLTRLRSRAGLLELFLLRIKNHSEIIRIKHNPPYTVLVRRNIGYRVFRTTVSVCAVRIAIFSILSISLSLCFVGDVVRFENLDNMSKYGA